jgi:hypothetical protein
MRVVFIVPPDTMSIEASMSEVDPKIQTGG